MSKAVALLLLSRMEHSYLSGLVEVLLQVLSLVLQGLVALLPQSVRQRLLLVGQALHGVPENKRIRGPRQYAHRSLVVRGDDHS